MANVLLEDLKEQISAGKVVVIIGAGVSIDATVNNPVASWIGLLNSGVDRCVDVAQPLPAGWAERARADIASGDLDDLLAAAGKVSAKLGASTGGEYGRWLRDTVGSLNPQKRETIEALRDLDLVLATTNYDSLIEEVTGLQPVTWMDGAKVERIVHHDDKGVLHLHGHWDKPESVILDARSYEKILGDAHAQTMLRALQATTTLLFVGCGEGLNDPNFGALLEWTGKVFAQSQYRRFRLARDCEIEDLRRRHSNEQRLFPVSYGKDHRDLLPFLRALRPSRPPRSVISRERDATPAQPAPLPPEPRCFGRENEIRDLVTVLLADTPKPVPILGPPGIGKSTITLSALHDEQVATRFGARRFFIRCDGVNTREALVAEIARFLGIQAAPGIEPAVLAALSEEPVALAIDNAETPWEADTLPVEEFLSMLASVPRLALVASLRGLQRPVQVTWREPSIQPPILPLFEARKVFLAIAGAGFAGDANLDDLLRAIDCVPLAITLLACAAEGEPNLTGTWGRWQDERTEMLQTAGGRNPLSNIEISYELSINGGRMTNESRRLLSLLALLPDGVAGADMQTIFPENISRAASVLRKTGLAFDEAGRMRLLLPLREYVRRKYLPRQEDQDHVSNYYLTLALDNGDLVGTADGADAAARLMPEAGNIEAMIGLRLESPDPATAIKAACSMGEFARFTGWSGWKSLDRAASVAHGMSDVPGEAHCVRSLGDIALSRSDHGSARARFEGALPLFKRVGDVLGEAICIRSLGDIALSRSDHESARVRFEEALPLFKRVGDVLGQANCIRSLGDIALRRSDHESARARFEEALPLFKRVVSVLGEANCILSLGDIALRRSDHESARARFEEALPLFRRVGDVLGEANCIRSLGEIALSRSDHESARMRFEEALPLFKRVGNVLGEANCIRSLGEIALRRSDHESARARFEEALPLFKRVGSVLGEANCIRSLGEIALRRSDHESARARFEEALPLFERVGDVLGEANCIKSLGNIAMNRSDHESARARFEEALPLFKRVGSVLGEANCIRGLGDIALDRSDHESARARFEEALPLYKRVGSLLGEANSIQSLGDIALERSDRENARARFEEALKLYERLPEPYSIGWSCRRLARLACIDEERRRHVLAARAAWGSINRQDLINGLNMEFPAVD